LENAIQAAINKWVKKSQEVAAEKMQWVMWSMWLPTGGGMPGM
jgi:DNA-binding protein YbaB